MLALSIYKWSEERPIELSVNYELSQFSFFHKGGVKEHIKFHSRTIVQRTPVGRRQSVEFEQNLGNCHVWTHPQGISVAVLADQEYPMRVAFTMMSEIIRKFLEDNAGKWEGVTADTNIPWPAGEEMFIKFQNPAEADKITKIEKELDEVKDVVMKSMDDILKRGETLDSLMQKSSDLSNTSYQFYRTAKKEQPMLQDVLISSSAHLVLNWCRFE